jgi:hypothetical protein
MKEECNKPAHTMLWVMKPLLLMAAICSVITSMLLMIRGRKHESLFVGQWVPTLLLLGLYQKLMMMRHHWRHH